MTTKTLLNVMCTFVVAIGVGNTALPAPAAAVGTNNAGIVHVDGQGYGDESIPRLVVVTAYYGSSLPLRDVTWPNKAAYCHRHGYDLVDAYATDDAVQRMVNTATLAKHARDRLNLPPIQTAAGHNDPMLNVKLRMFAHLVRKWMCVCLLSFHSFLFHRKRSTWGCEIYMLRFIRTLRHHTSQPMSSMLHQLSPHTHPAVAPIATIYFGSHATCH